MSSQSQRNKEDSTWRRQQRSGCMYADED